MEKLKFTYFHFSFVRSFVAAAENIPVDPEKEHAERVLLDEYQSKLNVDGNVFPDPISTKTGWIGEKNAITKWPTMIYKDMAAYFELSGPRFIAQLEREYKLGKAYRYFSGEFVREIYYHEIQKDHPYCFLRCRVMPSHRTSAKNYTVWACLVKDKGDFPGGKILSTYCTCVAGLKGTCNHVAGLLFRVDMAVMKGLTKPSKTSVLSDWNVPSAQKLTWSRLKCQKWYSKNLTILVSQIEIWLKKKMPI